MSSLGGATISESLLSLSGGATSISSPPGLLSSSSDGGAISGTSSPGLLSSLGGATISESKSLLSLSVGGIVILSSSTGGTISLSSTTSKLNECADTV